MWRYPGSIHGKTGLYKIELDFSELSLPADTIKEKAPEQREPLYEEGELDLEVNKALAEWLQQFVGQVEEESYDHSLAGQEGGETDQPGLPIVLARCGFFRYCAENAETLTYELWRGMITNLCIFKGGPEKIHELSKPYPEYSAKETDDKIRDAALNSSPMRCDTLRELGYECPQDCGVKSPAALAFQKVFVENGRYCAWKTRKNKNGEAVEYNSVPISNFTMQVVRNMSVPDMENNEACIRQARILGADGTKTGIVGLSAQNMVTPHEFKKFCLARGNYFWRGNNAELEAMLEYELGKTSGMIYRPDRIGYIADGKFWLFGNMAIPEGGAPIHPDGDGIIWVRDQGYMPLAFEGSDDEGSVLPVMRIREDVADYAVEVMNNIHRNLDFNGWMALGFCAAHVYLPEVVREFSCFPELFIYGKLKSGKNTLARWMLSFFGLTAPEKTISETSQNWIARALSYYSCMPVWLDEYRNERQITLKNGVLRNVYDRIGSGKGHLGFGGAGYPVRGSLILSGEAIPDDSALLSRSCVLHLSQLTRDERHYDTVNDLSSDFSSILVSLIMGKSARAVDTFVGSVHRYMSELMERNIDKREATNYGIIAAGVGLLPMGRMRKHFVGWLYERQVVRDQLRKEEQSQLTVFLEDLVALKSDGEITHQHFKIMHDSGDDGGSQLALWYSTVHNIWSEYYRRRTGNSLFSKGEIRNYIEEEDYFIEKDRQVWFGDGSASKGWNKRCLILDLGKVPGFFRDAFISSEKTD